MFRTRSAAHIELDLVNTTDGVAVIARAAVKLGYQMRFDPAETTNADEGVTVTLSRSGLTWLEEELPALVILQALAQDVPPETVLAKIRAEIDKRHGLGQSPRITLTAKEAADPVES